MDIFLPLDFDKGGKKMRHLAAAGTANMASRDQCFSNRSAVKMFSRDQNF